MKLYDFPSAIDDLAFRRYIKTKFELRNRYFGFVKFTMPMVGNFNTVCYQLVFKDKYYMVWHKQSFPFVNRLGYKKELLHD